MCIFAVSALFISCSGSKNESKQKTSESKTGNLLDTSSSIDNNSEFSSQQLNYQIKKLNAEINYLKEQLTNLDVKSSLYSDPFDV